MANETPLQPEAGNAAAQAQAGTQAQQNANPPSLRNAETGVPKHVSYLFWGALALATLAGMLLPSLVIATPEYVVEQYLMLALVPVLAYVLYKVV